MYKCTKVRTHNFDFNVVLVSLATRKHRAKVFSVIETNKIVKKGLENVTRNISNSVSCNRRNNRCQRSRSPFVPRNDMSLEEWWFAKPAEILSPLFVQRIDKFSFYFSTLVFSILFFTLFVPHRWFRIYSRS